MGKFKGFISEQHSKIDNLFEAYDIKIKSIADVKVIKDKETRKFAEDLIKKLIELDSELIGKITNILSYQESDKTFKVNPQFEKYSAEIKQFFKVKFGNGSSVKRKLPKGMTATIFFETFASLGFLSKANDINKLIKVKHPDIFVIDDINVFDKATQDEGMNIALSSMSFAKNNNIGTIKDIIHSDIDTFYKKLTAFEGIAKIKENTSDIVVILNGTKSDLYNALDNKEVLSYKDNGEITVGKVKFYQLSLKASKNARLGRVTTLFNDMYKGENSYDDIFNEGWKESISFIGNMAKKVYDNLKTGLVKILSKFAAMFNTKTIEKNCNSIIKKDKEVQHILKSMNESHDYAKLQKGINENFSSLKASSSDAIETYIDIANLTEPKTKAQINLLLVNKVSSTYLLKIVNDINKMGGAEYIQGIMDLMRKGSTKLPVVVLYGSGESEVLIDTPVVKSDNVPAVVIYSRVSNSSTAYYAVYLHFLVELKENPEDAIYTTIQFTNSGGNSFGFKAEGVSNTSYKKMKK